MGTISLDKKRKNIDLPVDTLQKLSITAASQGKSLKAFIENVLEAKADTLQVEISSSNPSPGNDTYFSNSKNLKELEERIKDHREGKNKDSIILNSAEEITNFINGL